MAQSNQLKRFPSSPSAVATNNFCIVTNSFWLVSPVKLGAVSRPFLLIFCVAKGQSCCEFGDVFISNPVEIKLLCCSIAACNLRWHVASQLVSKTWQVPLCGSCGNGRHVQQQLCRSPYLLQQRCNPSFRGRHPHMSHGVPCSCPCLSGILIEMCLFGCGGFCAP